MWFKNHIVIFIPMFKSTSTDGVGTINMHAKERKRKLDLNCILYTKINLKQIINLEVKKWNHKAFSKKLGQSHWNGWLKEEFLALIPKIQTHKKEIWSTGLHQYKILLLCESSREDEQTSYRLGETFVNHTFNKGLVSRLYKETSKLTSK